MLSGAQLRHAFKFVTPMLFDAFNGHLEAGSDRPVQRTDASSAGAINCMIVGGGVALRFNGRSKHIPTMLTSREVDVIKFIAVGALAGEHTDSMWWEREDVFSLMDADDNFEAPKAMKRSWARVVKSALNQPVYAPRYPGTAGSKDDWDRLVEHALELHNQGKLSGFIGSGAKDKWLTAPLVYPSMATMRSANMQALKSDSEVRALPPPWYSIRSLVCCVRPRMCCRRRPLFGAGQRNLTAQ